MRRWSEPEIQRALDEGRGWVAVCSYPPGQVGGPSREHGRALEEAVARRWEGSGVGWAEFGDAEPYVQFQFVVPPAAGSGARECRPEPQRAWDAVVGPGGPVRVDPWPGSRPGRL